MEGWRDEETRIRRGRKESGKRERTAKRRSDAGEEGSCCIVVQNVLERSGDDVWIAEKVDMIVSSKGIMWKAEKKRAVMSSFQIGMIP